MRGMLLYAADVARERHASAWKRARFALADERSGIEALAAFDLVVAWGESERLSMMRQFLGEA